MKNLFPLIFCAVLAFVSNSKAQSIDPRNISKVLSVSDVANPMDLVALTANSVITLNFDAVVPANSKKVLIGVLLKQSPASNERDSSSGNSTEFRCYILLKDSISNERSIVGQLKIFTGPVKKDSSLTAKVVGRLDVGDSLIKTINFSGYGNYFIPAVRSTLNNRALESISGILCESIQSNINGQVTPRLSFEFKKHYYVGPLRSMRASIDSDMNEERVVSTHVTLQVHELLSMIDSTRGSIHSPIESIR